MPRIIAKKDTLDELNANFEHQALQNPVFINSVPKCGTHLVRNIFRMFVAHSQHYNQVFIQIPVLEQHRFAFDPSQPKLSWGHLLFADDSAIYLKQTKHILLVRDPYDWILARARFFLSDNFQGNIDHLKNGNAAIDEILNMMIFGIYQKVPNMQEIFESNCLAWMGTKTKIVRYEDVIGNLKNLNSKKAESYFEDLFGHCGIELPSDWRKRIRVGSDRKQSGTARENLSIAPGQIIPDTLPDMQKKLVDIAIPGVREILGYA
ncbi:MAG: hypothetical protein COA47_08505 [Robiginitomaculum sp.]|nr:MAG: hypothetical protein COA47_08505 [Robiginitomaculum sp.]